MKKVLAFGLSVIFIITLFFLFFKREMVVVITNEGEMEVTGISAEYTGGSIDLPILAPKKSKAFRINPTGESTLILKYKDPVTKEIQRKDLDLYFETNYSGKIVIKFDSNGKISYQEELYWP